LNIRFVLFLSRANLGAGKGGKLPLVLRRRGDQGARAVFRPRAKTLTLPNHVAPRNITLDHDTALDCISRVVENHKRSLRANMYRELRLEVPAAGTAGSIVDEVGQTLRLPRVYSHDSDRARDPDKGGMTFVSIREMLPDGAAAGGDDGRNEAEDAELEAAEVKREREQRAVHRYMVSDDAYTLEKFYGLSSVMVQKLHDHCVKSSSAAVASEENPGRPIRQSREEEDQEFDYPFRPSEIEHKVISLKSNPPSSILLLGRSG
ncbi:MAG: hypothetical protein BJ554DRAFT_5847, partial [Olpidium bornovanus]